MLETIINGGILISIFAIAAPFIFVLLVVKIIVGSNSDKHRRRKTDDEEAESLDRIQRGLKDLNRRIDNLETLHGKKNRKE